MSRHSSHLGICRQNHSIDADLQCNGRRSYMGAYLGGTRAHGTECQTSPVDTCIRKNEHHRHMCHRLRKGLTRTRRRPQRRRRLRTPAHTYSGMHLLPLGRTIRCSGKENCCKHLTFRGSVLHSTGQDSYNDTHSLCHGMCLRCCTESFHTRPHQLRSSTQ